MSGTGSNTNPFGDATPQEIHVPLDPEELGPRIPEILRAILSRISVLENASLLMEGVSSRMSNLSAAQTTVQQSLNLLQAAHNDLHASIDEKLSSA